MRLLCISDRTSRRTSRLGFGASRSDNRVRWPSGFQHSPLDLKETLEWFLGTLNKFRSVVVVTYIWAIVQLLKCHLNLAMKVSYTHEIKY